MDNAQKFIMIGVGLLITLLVVGAVMMITGVGQDLLNQGQSELGGLSEQLKGQLTSGYDGIELSGTRVRQVVSQYYNSTDLVVVVNNVAPATAGGTTVATNNVWVTTRQIALSAALDTSESRALVTSGATVQPNASRTALSQLTGGSSDARLKIVSTGQYMAKLIDSNGSIIGIAFVRMF